jgi:DnaJ family protein C protein 13
VDQQRASQGPDGSYDLKDSQFFVYKALSKELFVGNVYLRVYNDQPDFEISEPEAFCVALIDFISHLLHNRCATDSDSQNEVNVNGLSLETSEHQNDMAHGSSLETSEHQNDMAHGSVNEQHETSENQSDLAAGSINEQQISDDSLAVSDGQVANKEKIELVKNLQSGLTSLQVHFSLVILSCYSTYASDTFLILAELTDKPSKFGVNIFY